MGIPSKLDNLACRVCILEHSTQRSCHKVVEIRHQYTVLIVPSRLRLLQKWARRTRRCSPTAERWQGSWTGFIQVARSTSTYLADRREQPLSTLQSSATRYSMEFVYIKLGSGGRCCEEILSLADMCDLRDLAREEQWEQESPEETEKMEPSRNSSGSVVDGVA